MITIDLDVTDDQTHGAQPLTFFNGFSGHWCDLPLVGTLTFDDTIVRRVADTPGRCHDQKLAHS